MLPVSIYMSVDVVLNGAPAMTVNLELVAAFHLPAYMYLSSFSTKVSSRTVSLYPLSPSPSKDETHWALITW